MKIRIPPHDTMSEQALLGAILISKNALLDVVEIVRPEMFYEIKHEQIYSAILSINSRREPVDIVSLVTELRNKNQIDDIGVAYISEIAGSTPISTNAGYYAKTIIDKYKLRNLAKTGEEIVELGFTDTSDSDKTIEIATSKILNMSGDTKREETDIKSIISEFDNTQEEFRSKQFGENKLIGISCGIPKIDSAIDGLRPGHFWSIAGYTSSGKTQMLLNILNHLLGLDVPVTFFSLEMSKADIISRLLGIETGVGMTKIMRHEFSNTTEVDSFTTARERLIGSKLKIYSKTNTLDGIILAMTRDILRNKTKVFAIDYIQLVRSKGKSEYEQITETSQRLQTFARETGCTIIVLSQVSNEHAKDQNQEVHGTKGGGSLPASVDLAIELFNEDKKEERDEKVSRGESLAVKAIIKKNRHGRCGYVKLDFTPWNGQFKESTDWDI